MEEEYRANFRAALQLFSAFPGAFCGLVAWHGFQLMPAYRFLYFGRTYVDDGVLYNSDKYDVIAWVPRLGRWVHTDELIACDLLELARLPIIE